MLLGEPPRSGGDLNFQLFGIPVRVHPFFWLLPVVFAMSGDVRGPELLIFVVAVFVSILTHELGHALTMRAFGMWPWITLTGFGGLASSSPSDAQRAGSWGQVLISFAGPGAQFLLAAVLTGSLYLAGYTLSRWYIGGSPIFFLMPASDQVIVSGGLTDLLNNLILVSVLWGVLNLIPVYPLDGGQIAREIFLAVSPRNGISQSLTLSIVAGACMVVVGLKMQAFFLTILFGFLAFGSYQMLQAYRNQRGW